MDFAGSSTIYAPETIKITVSIQNWPFLARGIPFLLPPPSPPSLSLLGNWRKKNKGYKKKTKKYKLVGKRSHIPIFIPILFILC